MVTQTMSAHWVLRIALAVTIAGAMPAADWQIETIDQGAPMHYSSMKADGNGNIHVAYVMLDQNRNPLRYAFWDRKLNRWFTMTIVEDGALTSLALDSKGRPHVSYTGFNSGRLHYAHWNGVKWLIETIPLNAGNISYYHSIVIGPDDLPSISFYEYEGPRGTDLRIRMRTVIKRGQEWELRTVDSQPGSGKFNAMAGDAQGRLHLAYANVSAVTHGMRYGLWDGKTWNVEILEGEKENNGQGVGWSCNVVVDKNSNPHLTYVNQSARLLKYAVRKDGRWQMQVVDRMMGIGFPDRNSIALDEEGRPYIGYYDAGRGILKVAHLDGDRWVAETVDSNGVGFTSSMQIDNGTIWISYADEASNALKVARRPIGSGPKSVSEAKDKDAQTATH